MYGYDCKRCFVPACSNTSLNAPNKRFVTVPENHIRKKRWFEAVRRNMPDSKSKFFCCEDHFNFKEDLENYVKFKLVGGKLIMKQDVVPHIFGSQADRTTATTQFDQLSTSFANEYSEQPAIMETEITLCRSIGIQVKPPVQSKYITCNMTSRCNM